MTTPDELHTEEVPADVLDRIDLSLAKIGNELPALATGFVSAIRQQSQKTRRVVWAAIAVCVLLGLFTYNTYQLTRERAHVGDQIADCTNLDGECYKRNQETLKNAITVIQAESQADSRAVVNQVICESNGGTKEACEAQYPIPAPIPGSTPTTTPTS